MECAKKYLETLVLELTYTHWPPKPKPIWDNKLVQKILCRVSIYLDVYSLACLLLVFHNTACLRKYVVNLTPTPFTAITEF